VGRSSLPHIFLIFTNSFLGDRRRKELERSDNAGDWWKLELWAPLSLIVRASCEPSSSWCVLSAVLNGEYIEPAELRENKAGIKLKIVTLLGFGLTVARSKSFSRSICEGQPKEWRDWPRSGSFSISIAFPQRLKPPKCEFNREISDWSQSAHLSKAKIDATTRKPRRNKHRTKRPKFGVKGKTPGVVLNMFDARANGKYS